MISEGRSLARVEPAAKTGGSPIHVEARRAFGRWRSPPGRSRCERDAPSVTATPTRPARFRGASPPSPQGGGMGASFAGGMGASFGQGWAPVREDGRGQRRRGWRLRRTVAARTRRGCPSPLRGRVAATASAGAAGWGSRGLRLIVLERAKASAEGAGAIRAVSRPPPDPLALAGCPPSPQGGWASDASFGEGGRLLRIRSAREGRDRRAELSEDPALR